ncbi:hypothetical protein [Clostridium paridis]|uniref:Uncharacterized protein n=1 Tax=Clostridium paridis TaxID=2803863 RepID=A0A937FIU8_9CLOT|nr:hypothetical protein [Clostridium paridis]MBL4932446.1 hypothetical protein [Clostridium paridis]
MNESNKDKDLTFRVFHDTLNLSSFPNGFESGVTSQSLIKSSKLKGDLNNNLFLSTQSQNVINPPDPLTLIRTIDEDEDDSLFIEEIKAANDVLNKIEQNNPGLISSLRAYNIPKSTYKMIVKRIIALSLKYNENNKVMPFENL